MRHAVPAHARGAGDLQRLPGPPLNDVARLRERILDLQARVEELEAALVGPPSDQPTSGPRLTPSQRRMLSALLRASPRVLSRQALLAARQASTDPAAAPKLVDVQIRRVRKAFAAAGLPTEAIVSEFGRGYRIPAEHVPSIRAVFWSAE